MSSSARILFSVIDQEVEKAARKISSRVFSTYQDMPWTAEQRKLLQPLMRNELERMVRVILARFDNVGATLPEEALGYTIHDIKDGTDIRDGNMDYVDMWRDYIADKMEDQS